ncbi:MAG TPA: hypothetical protein VHO69_10115 [Phototrophicaceae bacterium]|nr:hypothetical protein [Phototrophicaceae bacterium]
MGIRQEPDGQRLGTFLQNGAEVVVTEEPMPKGSYVWVKHAQGWSAARNAEGDEVFMFDLSQLPPGTPRRFRVAVPSVSVRTQPNGSRTTVKLFQKAEIKVDPTSRTEAGGYVWWKHDQGWTAECSTNGREIFLKEVFDAAPAGLEGVKKPIHVPLPAHYKGKMALQVAQPTKVRAQPSTDPRGFIIIMLKRGKVIEVDLDTVVEADGYFWARHDLGWSAIQSVDGKTVFLAEPGTIPDLPYIGPNGPRPEDLPGRGALVTRLPVDLKDMQWFQYFGNNMWAYTQGRQYGYDKYSQGLHGGLDLGNNLRAGIPVYAGVQGEYVKTEFPSKNNTRVILKNGPYTFIYQHITNPRAFTPGQAITPDTVVANIEHESINGGWNHCHFEVRFMDEWIINPLLLLTDPLYQQIITQFLPDKPNTGYKQTDSVCNFFFKSAKWTKWTTPLDQPMIKLAGPGIGPRFELGREPGV